jgi:pimeloyl-ACP methyl ester carboxylesterase
MSTYTDITFVSDDGLRLSARDYASHSAGGGAARLPVICIHGLTRNAADFDEFAPQVAALGRRVLALDVRGRGKSAHDPDPANYNPQVYAADVRKCMADLGMPRAVFVGTSMGGLITMTLATLDTGLIAAAILNDIGPWISATGLARIAGYAGRRARPDTWRAAADHVREINACAFPDNTDGEWDKWARRAFDEAGDGTLVARYDPNIALALQTGKLRPTSPAGRAAFRTLTAACPTLLVRGALSDLLEPRQAAWMRRAAPSMRYVDVPGVGHAPMLTEPAAFMAIADFLATVP